MNRGLSAALILVTVASSGCYSYTAIRTQDAVTGTRVRATVSPQRAAELLPVLRNVTPQLSGTLFQRSGSAILLDVPQFGAVPGVSTKPVNSRVEIPLSDLVTLESRTLSRARTGIVVGALVAAVAGGWVIANGTETINDKPKTGTDNTIRTIFRLPFGLIW